MRLRHDVLDDRRFWAFLYGNAFGQIGEPPEMEVVCSLLEVVPDGVEEWANQFTGWYRGIFDVSDG